MALNRVNSIKYLGSLVKEDGRYEADIKARIGMAKTDYNYGSKEKSSQSLCMVSVIIRVRGLDD